ncbi:MAG: hypothetical protein HYV63_06380, partial [Candidatus Schekmanbacteria bacterium]|nr:hypothetical protein [Candidatus Schekmanbacteria bacterium]
MSSTAVAAFAAGVVGDAAMLACSTTAAAAPVTAISGHAYLSGAAEHGGIAVSLTQVHVGFSGPALAALLIALAVVVAMAWRRGAGRPARLAVAGAMALAIAGGGGRVWVADALVDPLEAVTDASGSFSFVAPAAETVFAPGSYDLRYRREGYSEARRFVAIGADDGSTVVLDAVTLAAEGASPTPSATGTARATETPSVTATATAEPTASGTATVTPAAGVPSATGTATGIPTATPTAEVASSPTPTSTVQTATATVTSVTAATSTSTATSTPAPPAATATSTALPTASATATATPPLPPTSTPTPTSTRTPTPTATPTETPTPTPSLTPIPTAGSEDVLPPPGDAPRAAITLGTTFEERADFLYTGASPAQTGVAPGTLIAARLAIVRGRVTGAAGTGLAGVAVAVLDHPDLGATQTRADGGYDLAVNGGTSLVLTFAASGYLPVQRPVDAPWNVITRIDDVVLTAAQAAAAAVDTSGPEAIAVVRGDVESDADGTRQATVFFAQGAVATLQLPGGGTQDLTAFHVRVKEFTVGERGPEAMPGPLGPTVGYTYAAELSLDEADAAGATSVSFDRPVIFYGDNFLGYPVGETVPAGWFDRARGVWVPGDNGLIVAIIGTTGDLAELDLDGSGQAADAAALAAIGIGDDERRQLAALYTAGTELWRVPLGHFTPWDYNWPVGPPPYAWWPEQPDPVKPVPTPEKPHKKCQSSAIECEGQVLTERVAIPGAPFSLVYRSDRAVGYAGERTLEIPLVDVDGTLPPGVVAVAVNVAVAGRFYEERIETPGAQRTFTFPWPAWDGKTALGESVGCGEETATVEVGYIFDAVRAVGGQAFGESGETFVTADVMRNEIGLWRRSSVALGACPASTGGGGYRSGRDAAPVQPADPWASLAGWSLSIQHAFDPKARILHLGGGARLRKPPATVGIVAGTGTAGAGGDGGPAGEAELNGPSGVAAGPDGALYIADTGNHRVRRVRPDGIIETFAGTDTAGYSGDGGPATAARLTLPVAVEVAPDGGVLIVENDLHVRVRRVGADGVIETIADYPFGGAGRSAGPLATGGSAGGDVAVAPDGAIYVADPYHAKLYRIGTDGVSREVAGTGAPGDSGDGGPASAAALSSPEAVAVDSFGMVYIADARSHKVRAIAPSGIISTWAGTGSSGACTAGDDASCGDGGAATAGELSGSGGLAVTPDGRLLVSDTEQGR